MKGLRNLTLKEKDAYVELIVRAIIHHAKYKLHKDDENKWTTASENWSADLLKHVSRTFDNNGSELYLEGVDRARFNIPTLFTVGAWSLYDTPTAFITELEAGIRNYLK